MRFLPLLLCFGLYQSVSAQVPPNPNIASGTGWGTVKTGTTDSTLRANLLTELSQQHTNTNEQLTKQLSEFDKRIASIDQKIEKEQNAQKKIEVLVERVQILEKKENTVHENTLSVYNTNYQSAVINLLFMERELRPLILFNASREFFEGLTDVSNPLNYKGYNDWFAKFKTYIDKSKSGDVFLGVLDGLLTISGDMSKGLALVGPLANTLITGIGGFINSMSKKEQALRAESQKMFELTSLLSQFTHDRHLIETEWEQINKELDELQKLHLESLEAVFRLLKIEKKAFEADFANEQDANKRFEYIKSLTQIIGQRVRAEKTANPDRWKTAFYYQMQTIQSLKIRFGTLTFRIKENIGKYQQLITKYQKTGNPELKDNMDKLSGKLERLNTAFDATFNPQSYIQAANKMYIVD